MSVNSHIVIKNKLNETLSSVAEVLSESQRENISMDIDAGEWELALESLCGFLYKKKSPITLKTYRLLEEIESSPEFDTGFLPSGLENLKSQISEKA